MQRIILIFTFIFSILSCSIDDQLDQFDIIDSHGIVYASSNIGNQLRAEYELDSNPKMILILVQKADNSVFKEQLNILNQINAETYQYIYVTGIATSRNDSGYSLKSDKAKAMLSMDEFQIRIYDEFSNLIDSSKKIMSKQKITNYLTKSLSGR